jgi:hypothetical protein
MNEMRKTVVFVGAAVVLLALVLVTAPKRVTPDAFFDQGEAFFPEFTDPNAARTLEVIDFDEETGEALPFKVTFSDGRWMIPSHHNYPADGEDRLAQTAAGVIGITKDDFRTDNPADHAACGVIDPVDDSSPSLEGRGQRVTIRGENDVVLADLIIGKSFEGRENFRLVRVPGQKRVYGAQIDIDISTKFSDWIESDLMKIDKEEIDHVVLKDYSIDERTGKLDVRDEVVLERESDVWSAAKMKDNEEINRTTMFNLVKAIDEVSIVGVRPKPAGLSATLAKMEEGTSITQGDMLSLQSKGFYFTRDGRLVSNEGELQVRSSDGVTWTLRFGEVVYGSGLQVTAGGESADPDGGGEGLAENRYLMITTSFDPSLFPEPEKPENTDFTTKPDSLWTEQDYRMQSIQAAYERWEEKVEAGLQRSQELNERFGPWYYVITSESFEKLNLDRSDVLKEKTS